MSKKRSRLFMQKPKSNRLVQQHREQVEALMTAHYVNYQDLAEKLLSLSQLRSAVEAIAAKVDEGFLYAPVLSRPDALSNRLNQLSGELAKYGTLLRDAMRQVRVSDEQVNTMQHNIALLQDTIDLFRKGDLTAAEAREQVSTWRKFNVEFNEYLQNFNYGGRPAAKKPHTEFIGRRALILQSEHPDWSTGQIARHIIYQAKENKTPERGEKQALKVLDNSTDPAGIVRKAMSKMSRP